MVSSMRFSLALFALAGLLAFQAVAHANHANNPKAHWGKRKAKLVDSVDLTWDTALTTASRTWNGGLKGIGTAVVAGSDDVTTRENCAFPKRAVRVCNFTYGTTGIWTNTLALAQYSYSRRSGHIRRARIRLNDSVATANPGIEEATMAHEIGHILGLNHRPQSDAPGTCMTPAITAAQVSPDSHDFRSVKRLHKHLPHRKGQRATAADTVSGPADPDVHTRRDGDVVHVTWRHTR